MQTEENLTVGQWCSQWFSSNRGKWNGNTEGGYRNLICRHILPTIGDAELSELTEHVVTDFYDTLRSQGLSARSVWCVHLLLRRCMDGAARDQLIPYNPVRLCQKPQTEEYRAVPLRLGQIQRYLNTAEQLGVLPLIYTGLSSGLRQCELITLSWADFHVRYRYILKGQRLLTLGDRTAYLLEGMQATDSPYAFSNPKTVKTNALTPLEVEDYLDAAKRLGYLPMFMLALTAGLRQGELIALKWSDLDIEQRTLTIAEKRSVERRELVNYGNETRMISLSQEMAGLLIEEHAKHPGSGGGDPGKPRKYRSKQLAGHISQSEGGKPGRFSDVCQSDPDSASCRIAGQRPVSYI